LKTYPEAGRPSTSDPDRTRAQTTGHHEWIALHNASFSVKAEQAGTAFLPYTGTELEKVFSQQQERVVDNDNTVRYQNRCFQIPQQTFRFSLARCHVLVCEHLDATISLHYGPHRLGRYDSQGRLLPIHQEKRSHVAGRPASRSSPITDPAAKLLPAERKKNQKRNKRAA